MARKKAAPAEPLTVPEARAALIAAGVQVGARGRLSADQQVKAEELTGRKFA